jgi:hypothetical protein
MGTAYFTVAVVLGNYLIAFEPANPIDKAILAFVRGRSQAVWAYLPAKLSHHRLPSLDWKQGFEAVSF